MVHAMGRKIIVTSPAGQLPVLEEVQAHDEAQLQELLKAHPELLPLEDLGPGCSSAGRRTRVGARLGSH